ncbi:hypothetical protein M501DRAFT_237716 [Patellaria atrata CBS 101060]|uniref:Uncharacterized protein n=1 Tax=Patellaria atrata CBS 101060 TaxID=1346257 RepID=A0A9P4S6Y6_9PEZI|nr:hypothetical protein M501DRAFT_237716 [Patellaria atrata CBS 101060]
MKLPKNRPWVGARLANRRSSHCDTLISISNRSLYRVFTMSILLCHSHLQEYLRYVCFHLNRTSLRFPPSAYHAFTISMPAIGQQTPKLKTTCRVRAIICSLWKGACVRLYFDTRRIWRNSRPHRVHYFLNIRQPLSNSLHPNINNSKLLRKF